MGIFSRLLFCSFSSSNSRIQPSSSEGTEHEYEQMINNPTKTQLPVVVVVPTNQKKHIWYYLFAKRKLKREMEMMNYEEIPSFISYGPHNPNDNLFLWKGIIYGPIHTPFEGGIFHLSIKIPHNYPFNPPTVKFKTKVYHPYINKNGVIDVDILGKAWSPCLTIEKLMVSICSFLLNPDPEEDENQIAALYRRDRGKYDEIAREWTLKYAMST